MNAMGRCSQHGIGVDLKTRPSAGNFVALKGRGARFAAGDMTSSMRATTPIRFHDRGARSVGPDSPKPHGRRMRCLGDMLELGVDSAPLHAALARHRAGPRFVFLCGPHYGLRFGKPSLSADAEPTRNYPPAGTRLMRNLRAGDSCWSKAHSAAGCRHHRCAEMREAATA